MNNGRVIGRGPIRTTPGVAAKGITDTGSAALMRNGPVGTAGGLLFIACGPDRTIRALDEATGKTLWETQINAMPDGIPAVYEVVSREYITFYAAVGAENESVL